MRLQNQKVVRQGDHISIETEWKDRMKRPVDVIIETRTGELATDGSALLTQGDAKHVDGILWGLADIAWQRGWRPRGLIGKIAHNIENYILPPDVRN